MDTTQLNSTLKIDASTEYSRSPIPRTFGIVRLIRNMINLLCMHICLPIHRDRVRVSLPLPRWLILQRYNNYLIKSMKPSPHNLSHDDDYQWMHNNAMHACLDNLECMHSDLIFHFILIENFVKNFKNMYFGIFFRLFWNVLVQFRKF